CRERQRTRRRLMTDQTATMPGAAVAVDLPYSRELLLVLRLRVDLDAARLDAFLQRQRQAQHPMSMRGGQFLEVQELGNDQRLLVARGAVVSAFAWSLRANGEIVAGDLEGHILRIDARERYVNAPAVLRAVHVERWRLTGSRAGRKIAPELI